MNKILNYESDDFSNIKYNENIYAFIDFDNSVEKMIDFVYKMIDDSDYFYFYFKSNDLIDKYKQIFKYEVFDQLGIVDLNYCQENVHVFNIKSKESKKLLKDNISFNISDDDRWPITIKTNCKNIANDDQMFEDWIFFYKNDKVLYDFNVFDGYIEDYRKKELWLEQKGTEPPALTIKELNYKSNDFKVIKNNENQYSFETFDSNPEKMINFIYDRIDESDYFYYDFITDRIFPELIEKLNYEEISILKILNVGEYRFPMTIFNIKSKESKDFFKATFKFNITKCGTKKQIDIETSIVNIVKNELTDRFVYFFKDDKIIFTINIKYGYITDYRESKYWLKKINKF